MNRRVSIDLEREKDPEVLRQAALLLEAENRRLVAQVLDLTRALIAARGNDRVALQLEIEALQAQLEKRNKMLFGQSSEQRPGDSEEGAPPRRDRRRRAMARARRRSSASSWSRTSWRRPSGSA